MLTMQTMIHHQEAGAVLRKPDRACNRPSSNGSGKGKSKRKNGKKKKDASTGGDDILGDIFADFPPTCGERVMGTQIVAREWLLLKNTEVPDITQEPSSTSGERSSGVRYSRDESSIPIPNLSSMRRKESKSRKISKSRDANGNVRNLKGQHASLEEGEDQRAYRFRKTSVSEGKESKVPQPRSSLHFSDITTNKEPLRDDSLEISPQRENQVREKSKAPDSPPRKGSQQAALESGDKRDRKSGSTKGTSVKRHSSSRSTGSEGSTLRRLRRKGTHHSSAATQTPPGSHSELNNCIIPPDSSKRSSAKSHDGHGGEHKSHEDSSLRDFAGGIPGASLLLKLVMPRDKRSSRHSGGTPAQEPQPSAPAPPPPKPQSAPPLPWFWPPIRHVEGANPPNPNLPGIKGPPPSLPGYSSHGVAAGGGEGEAVGIMPPLFSGRVPFPPRAAPPVPYQIQGDQMSISSLNSSLAGHTYEQVNFIIEPPISESKENEYEQSKMAVKYSNYNVNREGHLKDSAIYRHAPTDPPWQERGGTRRVSSRKKRKKSRCAATLTDDTLGITENIQIDDTIGYREPTREHHRRLSLDHVENRLTESVPPCRKSSLNIYEDRRSSTTYSSCSSGTGGKHIVTVEKHIPYIAETNFEVRSRSQSATPPVSQISSFYENTRRLARSVTPETPGSRDVALIHQLLNYANQDKAMSQTSDPNLGMKYSPRRRGLYVPIDNESDSGLISDPETKADTQVVPLSPKIKPVRQGSSGPPFSWDKRDQWLCPIHGTAYPYQAGMSPSVQRRRLRRASLPAPVAPEPRPSFLQRLRRSFRRSRHVEPLMAELPILVDLEPRADTLPPLLSEELKLAQGVTCCCPQPVIDFRRFRPRLGSAPAAGTNDGVITVPDTTQSPSPDPLPGCDSIFLSSDEEESLHIPKPGSRVLVVTSDEDNTSPPRPGSQVLLVSSDDESRCSPQRPSSGVALFSSDDEDTTLRPPTPQDGCERWRVEGEVCRLREALDQRLGTPNMMVRRREHRLHTINTIEKTIQRLQQDTLRNQNNHNLQQPDEEEDPRTTSPMPHPSDIMDAVNANQLRDEDATTEDISEIREMDSLQSDTLTLHSNESGSCQAKARPPLMSQDSDKLDSPPDTLLPHHIPPGKMPPAIEAVLRGTWPFEKALWHSSPATMGMHYKNGNQSGMCSSFQEVPGIMATSSVTNRRAQSTQQLLTNKVEMVYGLLSMFSSSDRDDMSRTLLAMSSSPDSCVAMRQSGCLPLLIQLLHGGDGDIAPTRETRLRAAQALHNIVHSHPDDKRGRREARVLRLLEQIRDYSDYLYERLERTSAGRGPLLEDDMDRHPCPAMAALMKLSFDEDHRHAMCSLGGLHAIAELIRRDHDGHGSTTSDQYCITLRRYAGMALTNLTFGDGTNKALLCSFRSFMRALVSQLHSPSEDLRQVTASVLRNLSWRADGGSKASLRDVGAVAILMEAALSARKESTLKVILSAVWNLSAHCSINKAEICAVEGALAFICSTLTYKSQSKTLAIVENGGGILRNISSHIAVREDLRQVLREHNTLSTLLGQLRSPSLTVVSNACGTLWNLSARCCEDQRTLWELGAVPMLRSLINSKHKMISMGSSAALKNLLQARPEGMSLTDPRHGMGLPSLQARKQKALEQELDPSLSETCDNIETSPRSSPTHPQGSDPHFYSQPGDGPQYYPGARPMFHSLGAQYNNVLRSESRDSISSTHSDNSHDRMRQLLMRHQNGRDSIAENGRSLELSLRSMAPPSHCVPDIAHMSQEELQRHLDSNEFNGSVDEIFATRVRNLKEYTRQANEFTDGSMSNGTTNSRNGTFHGQGPQPPYSPSVSRRRPSNNIEEERTSGVSRNFPNGQQQPHNEAHYNIYSKYVNYSRNLAEVNIENDCQDEPISFSHKYSSSNAVNKHTNESMATMTQSTERPVPQIDNYVHERRDTRKTDSRPEGERDSETFTDLDQPTNFSLRYSEERDSDEAALYRRPPKPTQDPSSQFFESSMHDDSVKTYCTEGTPYETPYNFSTATSMTDLRESAIKEEIKKESAVPSKKEEKKEKEIKVENIENGESDDDVRDTLEPLPTGIPIKSGLSSGMLTPDKPITYCVEGTPVCLSRFSSVSSLTSGEINANNDRDGILCDDGETKDQDTRKEEDKVRPDSSVSREEDQHRDGSHTPPLQQLDRPEGKSVHYEETPLMFSRATSVSSLSSFEVQSIHDDRSSVVSDFSRFTSGAISPSDLPDSPTHTLPPSPKRSRPPSQQFKQTPTPSTRTSTGVFSEAPRAWVEEGTPIEFSRATSLSSLTIDDDLPVMGDSMPRDRLRGDGKDSSEPNTSDASRATSRGSHRDHHIPNNLRKDPQDLGSCKQEAESAEEKNLNESSEHSDSDILAECISSGMPDSSRRNKQQYSGRTPTRISQPSSNRARGSGIPVVKATNLPTQIPSGPVHNHAHQGICGGVWGGDTLRTYCTEDTPAISHATSISDLSQLSIPGEESNKSHSLRPSLNDSGDNSSDNDNLLEQCIQSGMPKARPLPKKEVKHHGSGHLCSHSSPAPVLPSPRRSPLHHPVPVARVTPAVKVGGTRISPRPSAIDDGQGDQVCTWATEGTPATFSRTDSLSSLSCEDEANRTSPRHQSPQAQSRSPRARTPQSPVRRGIRQPPMQQRGEITDGDEEVLRHFAVEGTPGVISRHSSLSSLEGGDEGHTVQATNGPQAGSVRNYGVEDTPVCFSRNSSLSSLSVDSYGEETTPTEQALLQQCISQGMPKSKSDLEGRQRRQRRGGSRIPAPASRSPARLVPGVPMQRLTLCREQPSSAQSKNVNAMTVAVDETEADAVMPTPDAESSKLHTDSKQNEKNKLSHVHIEEDEDFRDEEDEISVDHTEADSERTATTAELCDPRSEVTSEGSGATVVTLPIESKLHEGEQESHGEAECGEGNGSSPEEKQSWVEPRRSSDKSSPSEGRGSDTSVTASMSESGILAIEAMKVARAVAGEAKLLSSDEVSHMSQSIASAASDAYIENIKPPSAMGSLASMSNSLTSSAEDRGTKTVNRKLECRHTRRMPEMVRRALGDQEYGSTENMASMASSCHSNVDNIPPPSMLDDDMENSMISVASITSEVAEQRESPPSPPVDHSAMVGAQAKNLAAVFQREALNAASTVTLTAEEASTYQEITEITEHEDTVGPASDTELAADDLPADIPELPQDGVSSPLCNSAHSSPHRLGTPRSRRRIPKDRYRTFTRDGEVSDATPSQDTDPTLVEALPPSPLLNRTPKQRRQDDSDRFRTRTISISDGSCHDSIPSIPLDSEEALPSDRDKISPRRSPKDRRLQDPDRFQTHVISEASVAAVEEASAIKVDPETYSIQPKLQGRQSFRQRRQEDRERYQTRTIDVPLANIRAEPKEGTETGDDGGIVDFQDSNEMLDLTAEQLEALQQDANIVICTLNETREAMTSESSDLLSEENILDIETLSLISNEDESEMKNFLQEFDEDPPDKDEQDIEPERVQVLRRPRIVKPGEESFRPQEEDEGQGKSIRGRRKGLYPGARKYNVTAVKPIQAVAPPIRNISARPVSGARPTSASPVKPSSPKLPRATRASALRQTSNLQKGGSSGEDSPTGRATGSSASSAGSSPRLGPGARTTTARPTRSKSLARPTPESPKPLRRQNTFTKDDSDTPPSPERNVSVDTKKTIAPVRALSKPRLRRDIVQPSPAAALPTSGIRSGLPKSGSQDLSPLKGRPPQGKSASLTRDARPPTSGDIAEWRDQPKKTTVKKEVTSRIANLWKKVERAQNKPKQNDSRVWISRPKSAAAKETPPKPLVRSSTFEKLPNNGGVDVNKGRTRLGLKLAKLRGRDTRSSPPSEATTPVDPRPHCLVSPTRMRTPEVVNRPSEAVQLRQRPATHPPGTHIGQGDEDSETKAKRLSRLGSFIVVEEDGRVRSPPQSAIVPPFNYQAPVVAKVRSGVATRIPQPSKPLLSNTPCRDDNGNAPDTTAINETWRP
ncbi:anaphase-promoting complex subunit 2 [Halocaridina rubra]|uniref:Anaphase-promoting complex subunit 2 n=1 Tax=Halocaridina rubra TaxID=373956 RepID=A0AAN8WSJ1_HALRR